MIIEDKISKYDECISCKTTKDIKSFRIYYREDNIAMGLTICKKCAKELFDKFKEIKND